MITFFPDRKKAESLADLPEEEIRQIRQRQIERALKRELYNWQPIDYDDYTSVIYMASRLPANFAALKAVFTEVNQICFGSLCNLIPFRYLEMIHHLLLKACSTLVLV